VVDAVLEEAGRFSATVLAPLNSVGDEIGCVLDQATGEVTTPPGFKQAYDQFVDGGWTGLTASPSWAARACRTLGVPLNEMINAANLAGQLPAALARRHRSAEAARRGLAARGLPEAADRGRWTGTMCLTEHCGTDLGLLRPRPSRRPMAATDHRHQDLHHRRRARHDRQHRAPGAGPLRRTAGRQGHLAVRRAQVQGRRRWHVGERNALRCGSIEHKMGIKGRSPA
jgi:hypothetical protein